MTKDYYKTLGVNKTASESEIKDAYMKSVKKYHPDLNPGNKEHEEKFKEINEAYDTLKDSSKRKQYDSFGSEYAQGNYQNYQQYSRANSNNYDFDFDSIFKNFGFDFGENNSQRQTRTKAADLQYAIEITLEEAFYGTTKKIEIPSQEACSECKGSGHIGSAKTCSYCNGVGQVKRIMQSPFGQMVTVSVCDRCNGQGKSYEKKCNVCKGSGIIKGKKNLEVKIPKGVVSGTVLRLQGEGFSDSKYKGDLYIKIVVAKHHLFSVEHNDIYTKQNIDLLTALLGKEVEVKTIDGKAKLRVPQGTQSHTTLRMKGQGMPELNSNSRGDQYVQVIVDLPNDLTKEQKEALEIIFDKNKKGNKDFLKKLKDIFK